jgi:hypothetical protein
VRGANSPRRVLRSNEDGIQNVSRKVIDAATRAPAFRRRGERYAGAADKRGARCRASTPAARRARPSFPTSPPNSFWHARQNAQYLRLHCNSSGWAGTGPCGSPAAPADRRRAVRLPRSQSAAPMMWSARFLLQQVVIL